MTIVGGFDVHRAQITFDYLDTETGEVSTGQIRPATREVLRSWLGERFGDRADVALAVEGCTGWRFVVEELIAAGVDAHLAEPADTATQRGRKKRAKTDRADARLLRELLRAERLPESWVPPTHVLEVRTLGRLYVDLMDERRAWQQRIHAQLFHQGVPAPGSLLSAAGQEALASARLSPAGRQMVDTAQAAIDALSAQCRPLRAQLQAIGRRQPGARAVSPTTGSVRCRPPSSGPSSATAAGSRTPTRRFATAASTSASTPRTRSVLRAGSPELRWALFEAAKSAARASSPDHAYSCEVRDRLGGKCPALSVARKLVRRCHHTLCELGDEAWVPLASPSPLVEAA